MIALYRSALVYEWVLTRKIWAYNYNFTEIWPAVGWEPGGETLLSSYNPIPRYFDISWAYGLWPGDSFPGDDTHPLPNAWHGTDLVTKDRVHFYPADPLFPVISKPVTTYHDPPEGFAWIPDTPETEAPVTYNYYLQYFSSIGDLPAHYLIVGHWGMGYYREAVQVQSGRKCSGLAPILSVFLLMGSVMLAGAATNPTPARRRRKKT